MMFAATTLAGVLNYLYPVYIGRAFRHEDSSVFGALFAIFYMVGIVGQTLGTSATSFVSRFTGNWKHIGYFLAGSLKCKAIPGFFITLLFLASSNGLFSLLKVPDAGSVIVLAPILFTLFRSEDDKGLYE